MSNSAPDITEVTVPCGLMLLNPQSHIVSVNETFCHWLGIPQTTLLNTPLSTHLPTASMMLYLGHILPSLHLHGHVFESYIHFKTANQADIPMLMNMIAVHHQGQRYYSAALMKMQRRGLIEERLIVERKKAEQAISEKDALNLELTAMQQVLLDKQQQLVTLNHELKYLAITDALTGLFNRRFYDKKLKEQIEHMATTTTPFALILLDIDLFKGINDRYGHDMGDAVLKQLAQTLQKNRREQDILARVGGEEFSLLLPETDVRTAAIIAEQHRQHIAQTPFGSGTLTASFGVTVATANDSAESIYSRADKALYRAKQQSRNCVVVHEGNTH